MDFQDKVLECMDCGSEFTHSAEDQARYAERGFNDPKRCRPCRDKRKAQQQGGGGGGGGGGGRGKFGGGGGGGYGGGHGGGHGGGGYKRREYSGGGGGRGGGGGGYGGDRPRREFFEAVCAECGVTTTVPFKPVEGRPVYCRDCYQSRKSY